MDKLKNIISERKWYHPSKPLEVFEARLKDIMNLQVSSICSNISESAKNEAKKQYLIMLVTCYETYAREIFKIIIDEELVSIGSVTKIKKIKDVKFTIEEIEYIRKKNIELSELICEYINFQNFGQLMNAFSIINLDKKIEEKLKQKGDMMPLPDSNLLKKEDGAEIVNEFFKKFADHKKLFNKKQLYHQINLLLQARHKIVHKNIDIKIEQNDIIIMTSAAYEFVIILERIIQELSKKSTPE